MKKLFRFLVTTLLFSAIILTRSSANAAVMIKNDFRFGSTGFKQDTLSIYVPMSMRIMAGASGSYYKSNDMNKVHSVKLPLVYLGESNMAEAVPFAYSHKNGMTAYGGKISLTTNLLPHESENFFYLTLTGAQAWLKGHKTNTGLTNFSQSAIELKAETSYYKEFHFTLSAAGFAKPTKGTNNKNLAASIFDQKDLVDFNGYEMLKTLPEWIISTKVSRNFQPEFNSSIYAGYSKLGLRNMESANSYITGIEFYLEQDTTLDLGYNYFKYHDTSANQYFKVFLSLMF